MVKNNLIQITRPKSLGNNFWEDFPMTPDELESAYKTFKDLKWFQKEEERLIASTNIQEVQDVYFQLTQTTEDERETEELFNRLKSVISEFLCGKIIALTEECIKKGIKF